MPGLPLTPAATFIRAMERTGISAIVIAERAGACSVVRVVGGAGSDLECDVPEGPTAFRVLWKDLMAISGPAVADGAIFMPAIRLWEMDGRRVRLRYCPRARLSCYNGSEWTCRTLDILIGGVGNH